MDGRFVGRHVAQEIGDGGAVPGVVGVALADLIVEESGVAHGGMLSTNGCGKLMSMPRQLLPAPGRQGLRNDPGQKPVRKAPEPAALQAESEPAALDRRLVRAKRLGHNLLTPAAAAPPSRVQRAVGFELELQVLLTSGKPLEPSETLEYPSTVEDLASSRLTRRPQVKETRHTVVLADGRVLSGKSIRWRRPAKA